MGIIRDNPVFWREGVPKPFRRASPNRWAAIFLGAAVFSLLGGDFLASQRWDSADLLALMFAWLWSAATLIIVPGQTAQAIVKERLQGTWDAVILTRLRLPEILFGKLFAILIPMWLGGLFFLPACLMLAAAAGSPAEMQYALLSVACAYAAAVIGGLGFGALGLLFSMRCSSAASAQAWTFSIMLVVVAMLGIGGTAVLRLL